MPRIQHFFRTVYYLRPRQWLGQLRHVLRARLGNPKRLRDRKPPRFPGVVWRPVGPFLPPGTQENTIQRVLSGKLTFLNRTIHTGWPPAWQPTAPKLWQYNLHYFETLWALDYASGRQFAGDWIEKHPLARRQVGWEPYATSLRLQNWLCYFFGRHSAEMREDEPFSQTLWKSVWLQAEWLRRNLETRLLGNHFLENAAALSLLGACFEGPDARRWLAIGERILREQLAEQVLPDGGHVERSPMYHLRVTYALALAVNSGDSDLREIACEPLRRMVAALPKLCHPDGQIALFNDSAIGVYNNPKEVLEFARRALGAEDLGEQLLDKTEPQPDDRNRQWITLPDMGYYGARSGVGERAHYVLCDAGPIGPDYQPGHAHGDIFSFELSLFGACVVSDTGVFDYERSAERRYSRSTAAHSTVEINGQDQCEFWGAFRVGRRARVHDVRYEPSETGFRLSGWHDGYRHLPGRPTHFREFVWNHHGIFMVRDSVDSQTPVDAVSRLFLHPSCAIIGSDRGCWEIASPNANFFAVFHWTGRENLVQSTKNVFPQMGSVSRAPCLELSSRSRRIQTGFCLSAVPVRSFDLQHGVVAGDLRIGW